LKAATSPEKRKAVFANESDIDPPGAEPNRYLSTLPARGSATDVENVRPKPPRFGAMSARLIALLMMKTQAARP